MQKITIKSIVRITLQAAAALAALFMLVWSCCATPSVGTVVGVVLFGAVAACAVMARQLWLLLKRLWSCIGGRVAVVLVSAVVAAGVGLCGFFTVQMLRHISRPAAEVKCVIVLGCRIYGDQPSSMIWVRTRAAYNVLCEHPDAVCIVSGGQGSGESITEAEAMYRLLTEWGIPSHRIYKEDRSTSTEENMEYSAGILKELGITDGIAIATSEYHQYRATLYAERSGLTVSGNYSGGTSRLTVLNAWLREWAALAIMQG